MNNNCYSVYIKQNFCQGGIQQTVENTYSNIPENTSVDLKQGYVITFLNYTSTTLSVAFKNEIFIPDITFEIQNQTTKIFNLPCFCGTYEISICVEKISCLTCPGGN